MNWNDEGIPAARTTKLEGNRRKREEETPGFLEAERQEELR